MSKYKLVEAIVDNKWDLFIDNSRDGTIFMKSYYLNSCNSHYKAYYCYKQDELRASVLLNINDNNESLLDDFVIYNGIVFGKPTNKQNKSQMLSEQFEVQTFIAEKLITLYNKITISLNPSIVDIRPFLWVHYGEDKPKYDINIRYTAYLNIEEFINKEKFEDIEVYKNASTSRRQQIRYAKKKMYFTKIEDNIEYFIKFYQQTMTRQDIEISSEYLKNMHNLITSLIVEEKAYLYATCDDKNEIASMALFGWDSKRAYYIFGASDPIKRNGHSGTAVIWDALFDLRSKGITEVDLEGVNSPQRGWFKLSFGGDIIPYYEITYGDKERK